MPTTFDGIINEPTVDFVGKDGFFWWFGEVVYIEDPLQLGRVKVRIMGWYTGLDKNFRTDMPDEDLPWAVVLQPTNQPGVAGSGQSAGHLQQGAMVMGFFLDGQEGQQPVVMGVIRSRKQPGSAQANDGINSLFSEETYDATANAGLVNSATNTVTNQGAAAPANTTSPPPGETTSTADANLFGTAAHAGGSSANPSVPAIIGTTAGNAVAGGVNTFEGTLTRMMQNIAVAGSQVVAAGNGSYNSIINGQPVNIRALVGTATNLISSVLSEALAAVKEVFLTTIATGLKALKIAGIFGIPFVVTTAIQLIIQIVLKFLCGLDASWLNGILNILSGTLESFVNNVLGAAFDQLASLIQSAFDDIINQMLCAINGALNAIQSVITAVSSAVAVAKTVSDVMKKGTAFFQNLEKLNIQDISSITSIISLIIGLIPTQCNRTAPGGDTVTTFIPFLGSTECDVIDANPLGNIAGSCGSFSSSTGGGAAAGVQQAANAVQAILTQADAYLTTVENHLDGSCSTYAGTPGRRARIERFASGATWWSIRSNDQEYRNWKERKDAERSGRTAADPITPDASKTIFGDTITFPGATQFDFQKDLLFKNLGQFQHNVDGSYKLKIVGDLDIEIGGRLAVTVGSAPQKKLPTGANNSKASDSQSKNVIKFLSDTEISGSGKIEVQGMGTTTSSKPGTDVKLNTDTLNLQAPSLNINCSNDLKLCAGNAIYVETPSLIRNINFPPLPRVKSGIFTIMHGSYDMIINPSLSGADAIPRYTVNNTVGPMSFLVGAGGLTMTVAAGGLTATVAAGAIAMTAAAGALSLQSSAAMTLTAGAIMSLTAATIKLN
jgi:Gp5 N-terminal OB domain